MPVFPRLTRASQWLSTRYAGHPIRVAMAAVQGLLVLHVFWKFGYSIEPTLGASMLPTIEVMGDHVLISKRYRRGRGIQVGDVIGFNSVYEPGETVIKRVLGMPGDYVLRDSPESPSNTMIQVPEGHCWVIGDNIPYSRDSRHFGPLPMGLVRGKVLAVVFPWRERRWFEGDLKPVENYLRQT